MSNNRRIGREYALKILFSLKFEGIINADVVLENFWRNFRFADDVLGEPLEDRAAPVPAGVHQFTDNLVQGVLQHRAMLDQRIGEVALNWSLSRMSPVDLTLLRMATYELLLLPDIPVAVTLNEAIELAKRYGTRESPGFVNGLLDKIARSVADKKADL